MTHRKCFPVSNRAWVLFPSLLLLLPLLAGCGTSSYGEAVNKSKPELELRSKFAALGSEYVKFPDFPISFRVPNVFLENDKDVKQRWKAFGGKAVKLNSKDPANPDSVGNIPPAYAVAPEFFDAMLNQAHQGTFLAEYRITLEDPQNQVSKSVLQQHLMMSIWVFDATGKVRPPNDASLLLMVKGRGREQDALSRVNAAQKKAEKPLFKPGGWEDDDIPVAPGAGNSAGSIQAKMARFFVKSSFLSSADNDQLRRPVEKDGAVRLWSFRLDNKYQVYLMIRVPLEMTGDSGEYPIDAESADADKLVELGRAVIGSMVVSQEAAPEAGAKKK